MLRRPRLALSCLGLILAACNTAPDDPTEPTAPTAKAEAAVLALANTWATKAPIPRAATSAAAGAINNVIYFVGGLVLTNHALVATDVVRAYTIATNSWSLRAKLPGKRIGPNGASTLNGRLYVSGGVNSSGVATKTLFEYNPGTNTWTQKANMPFGGSCGAQGVIAGQLYVYTVQGNGCSTQHRFFRYNPGSNTWTTLPAPPSRHASGVGGVIGGKFYLAGGTIDNSTTPNLALHVYNPALNAWVARAPLPSPQQNTAGGALLGKLYLAGGTDFTQPGFPTIATVRSYDPGSNTWSTRAPMLTARESAAGTNSGGKLWIISGFSDAGRSTKNEAYTP
jgi:N-acetylneuraminic acid mutarotase